ncbi:hypothetical protein PUW25_26465 (plasmid) [Paenibacillus urinalis]|uniref:Gp5/Type VI secretion system Vgr protein OB-fold domain-containing protein n=1 Tax=Paenibacillus urinalis TaxID=521520 RepID=A0ABY7XH59_9BACL|nr:hypothetical protein [Paenibacillus urinalis]WDI05117.1 hypothetical protein PUW25_26465 [Paenibacillus urinalis]
MPMEQGNVSRRISQQGTESALDKSTSGLIGYVTEYYPNASSISKELRHTVDIDVPNGSRTIKYYGVPCFVYSQGVIDKGLEKNDRVWVQFINGDRKQPIVTGYYREPGQLDLFWNNLKFRVSDFFSSLGV